MRTDLDNYRSAMSWLIERERPAEASDIASALRYFWLIRGHAAEGLRWYEQILNMPSVSTVAESKALVGAAVMWFAQGELDRARIALERSLRLAWAAGDMYIVADGESTFGHVERAAEERKCRARLVQQQPGEIPRAEHAVGRRKSADGHGSDCSCHRRCR